MPVINMVPQDLTDLVIQGEQMRAAAVVAPVSGPLVAGAQSYAPMVGSDPVQPIEVLRSPFDQTMVASNAVISTPCGALVPLDIGRHVLEDFVQSAERFAVTSVTRDSAGTPLAGCRVLMLEQGQLAVTGSPVVGETISDGSGNYTINVPGRTGYQAIAYKAGSPDVAGISVVPLTDVLSIG